MDAPDANCTHTSADRAILVDEEKLTGFLARLKREPIPWSDPDAVWRWLSAYGSFAPPHEPWGKCDKSIDQSQWRIPNPIAGLPGLIGVSATLPLACSTRTEPARMHLMSTPGDMFAPDKARRAIEASFGQPVPECTEPGKRQVWRMGDDMIILVEMGTPPISMSILIAHAAVERLSCRRPPP